MSVDHLMGYVTKWPGSLILSWLTAHSPRFRRHQPEFVHARRDGIPASSMYFLILVFAVIFATGRQPLDAVLILTVMTVVQSLILGRIMNKRGHAFASSIYLVIALRILILP
jgi:hypothetical protein